MFYKKRSFFTKKIQIVLTGKVVRKIIIRSDIEFLFIIIEIIVFIDFKVTNDFYYVA